MGIEKRDTMALSAMEAGKQSDSLCGTEVVWLPNLWPQLGYEVTVTGGSYSGFGV